MTRASRSPISLTRAQVPMARSCSVTSVTAAARIPQTISSILYLQDTKVNPLLTASVKLLLLPVSRTSRNLRIGGLGLKRRVSHRRFSVCLISTRWSRPENRERLLLMNGSTRFKAVSATQQRTSVKSDLMLLRQDCRGVKSRQSEKS